MANEPLLKMQAQATSAMLAMCSGLAHDDGDDDDDGKNVNGQEIMQQYAGDTLQALTGLLEKGISEKYELLQTYSLSLIGTIAEVIREEFAPFFDVFIKAFATIINSPDNESTQEGRKLSAKAIDTMG
jgi:hypothetical protein